jgi:CheY-like chemotaxis protein
VAEPCSILIVDDDEGMADMLSLVLEGVDRAIRVARNGEEGLAEVTARRPDLIVLDVEMPVLDGPAMAYRLIVRDAGDEGIPIVVVSGVMDLPRVAARVGTEYYLAKPFGLAEVTTLVARALRERHPPHPPPAPAPTAAP